MNTPTENIQNSAQNTNVTKNQKEHSQNSAQTLTNETIKPNTYKTEGEALT